MVIKEKVNIQDDKLTNGLGPLARIMNIVDDSDEDEIVLDCSSIQFVSPVFVISLMLYLSSCSRKVSVVNSSPYLQTIQFNDALKPDEMSKDEFERLLQSYEYKTFIPIVSFPASSGRSEDKDTIMSAVENLLCKQLKLAGNVSNGLKYIIGEMVDNITEHSESKRGYVFAQAYRNKGFLDLCIADEGITLYGSFNKAGIEVSDDIEAMQAANKGVSSKNLPDAENRGYGIYTTKKMLISGLGGQYMMMSGNAIYMNDKSMARIIVLPGGMRWNGTIVALRIPFQNEDFRYSEYFE